MTVRLIEDDTTYLILTKSFIALCWIADKPKYEVFINGLRRGISPKNRHNPKFWYVLSAYHALVLYIAIRPSVSKVSLFRSCDELVSCGDISYREAKNSAGEYQSAKAVLLGPTGPFSGWVKSGEHLESFTSNSIHTTNTIS